MRRVRDAIRNSALLYSVVSFAQRVWREKAFWRPIYQDYRATWAQTDFLRALTPAVGADSKRLLIFAVDDASIYSLKLFAFVTQSLRARGWKITVVLRHRGMILGRLYFRCFGIDDFVYLSDILLDREEMLACRQKRDELLSQPRSLQSVKQWQFQGSWIGPQIIATLSRLQFEGMINFENEQVADLLKRILLSCLEQVVRARKLMQSNNASLAITIEANYAAFGPLVDMAIAHNIPVVQMIQPWRDEALTFWRLSEESRREHPSSVSNETLKRFLGRPWGEKEETMLADLFEGRYGGRWFLQARNQQNTRSYSRGELLKCYGFQNGKPIAVVFCHVLWDANLFYGKDIFEDYGEWFIETVKAACRNTSVNWLIKTHPVNVWKRSHESVKKDYAEDILIRQHIGALPAHVKIIGAGDDINTVSLFDIMDFAVTVRGTAGMEAPCFGKHCVTAGTGRYSNRGFTLDCHSREQYFARLANLHLQVPMNPDEIQRAKWHALIAFQYRHWTMQSARAIFNKLPTRHPLFQNLEISIYSEKELLEAGDLQKWSVWAEGTELDYVDDPIAGIK